MCIGEYNPDIIIGTETHLDSSVNSYQIASLCCPRMITLIHSGIQELEEDGSQRDGGAALKGRGCRICGHVGQLCGE